MDQIGVVGAGQMGRGIAQVAAQSGCKVILFDADKDAPQRALSLIRDGLERIVAKGKITEEVKEKTLQNIVPVSSISDFSSVTVAIEAIVEDLAVKEKVFIELDSVTPPNAILATNTSSLPITKIAAMTTRPDRVIGMHFMNPVPVMKLVEIIRGLQTSDSTYNKIVSLTETLGKISVLGIDSPGFIVNRILVPMINEAIFLLQEGVKAQDIDVAMKLGTNQPMGPLELADFVGLDTLLSILRFFHRELGEDKYRPCPLLIKYVEAGWYGRKNGRGFYEYES
jgi:3-hydroxybutyryl-CoA dehydrogenase